MRAWRDEDAGAAAGLTRRFFAPDPAWDEEEARARLTGDVMGGGEHVRVVERAGRIVGLGAYVSAPPSLFLWPAMGEDGEAVGAVIDALVAAGRGPGVDRARVSVRDGEPGKEEAVRARGFVRSIDFVEVVRTPPAEGFVARAAPPDLVLRSGAAIDRAAMHATHDLSFSEISNTAPTTDADFAGMLDGPSSWPAATAGWFAEDGTCAAFVLGFRYADHGVVEAIGTHPAYRRRGLGAVALDYLLAAAAREGVPEVRAFIASDNPGSLGLHAAAGFAERGRKQVWQLAL